MGARWAGIELYRFLRSVLRITKKRPALFKRSISLAFQSLETTSNQRRFVRQFRVYAGVVCSRAASDLAPLNQLIKHGIAAMEACSFDREKKMIKKTSLICALAVALTVLITDTTNGQIFRRSNAGYAPMPVQGRLTASPSNYNSGYAQRNSRLRLKVQQQPSCSCQGNQAQVAQPNFSQRRKTSPTQGRTGYAIDFDPQANRYVLRPVAGQGNNAGGRNKDLAIKQVDIAQQAQRQRLVAPQNRIQPATSNSVMIATDSRTPLLTAPATVVTTTIEPQSSAPQLSAPKSTAKFTPIEAGVSGTLTSDTGQVIDQQTQGPITKTIAIDKSINEPTPAPVPEGQQEKRTFSILDSTRK